MSFRYVHIDTCSPQQRYANLSHIIWWNCTSSGSLYHPSSSCSPKRSRNEKNDKSGAKDTQVHFFDIYHRLPGLIVLKNIDNLNNYQKKLSCQYLKIAERLFKKRKRKWTGVNPGPVRTKTQRNVDTEGDSQINKKDSINKLLAIMSHQQAMGTAMALKNRSRRKSGSRESSCWCSVSWKTERLEKVWKHRRKLRASRSPRETYG